MSCGSVTLDSEFYEELNKLIPEPQQLTDVFLKEDESHEELLSDYDNDWIRFIADIADGVMTDKNEFALIMLLKLAITNNELQNEN